MNVAVGLYSHLSTFAGLTALVGTRIYPSILPQAVTLPAITYQKISAKRTHTMGDDPGLAKPRFQITCWADTPASARAVATQVQTALQNQRNALWGGVGGVTVTVLGPDNEVDDYERTAAARDIYSIIQDYFIWHDE